MIYNIERGNYTGLYFLDRLGEINSYIESEYLLLHDRFERYLLRCEHGVTYFHSFHEVIFLIVLMTKLYKFFLGLLRDVCFVIFSLC